MDDYSVLPDNDDEPVLLSKGVWREVLEWIGELEDRIILLEDI